MKKCKNILVASVRNACGLLAAFMVAVLAICILSPISVKAESPLGRVVDDSYYLTDEEYNDLRIYLDALSGKHGIDISVVIVDTYSQYNVEAAADDFYDYNGYGMGPDNSGIMFYISMYDREWHITTTGSAIKMFSDYTLESIGDDVAYYLSDGYYYEGLMCFADECDAHLIDINTYHWGRYLAISLGIGLVVALIYTLILRGQLKSVAPNDSAVDYVKSGSMHINHGREIYLYRNVNVTRKESSSGSSTHTGSSGTSHGGASGRF